jgi:Lar family restriction alleviation protein
MELKPCPFCGGEAMHAVDPRNLYNGLYFFVYTYCSECGVQTNSYKRQAEATKAWNRRAK